MMEEIFWNSISAYNAATWPWQLAFVAVAAVLTLVLWFRPARWARTAMKIYMVAVSLWIAFVYYMKFAAARDFSNVLTIFWCMVAASWLYDLVTGFSTFQKSGKTRFWGAVMLLLPLAYPLISIARGLEFPQVTTPVIPSAVALYMLGMLMVFNRKINFFAFIFIFHWAIIAMSKISIFNIPEDILLAAACIPSMAVFFIRAVRSAGQEYKPSRKYVEVLIVAVALVAGACMFIA